jgi:hypothetical protein
MSGSNTKPANIAFRGEIERFADIKAPFQTDRRIGPVMIERKASIQLPPYTIGDLVRQVAGSKLASPHHL